MKPRRILHVADGSGRTHCGLRRGPIRPFTPVADDWRWCKRCGSTWIFVLNGQIMPRSTGTTTSASNTFEAFFGRA